MLGVVSTEQEAREFIDKREAEGTDNDVWWMEMPVLDADTPPPDGDWIYVITGFTGNIQDELGDISPCPRAVFAVEHNAQDLYDRQMVEDPGNPPFLVKVRVGEIHRVEEFGPFRELD